MPLVFLSVNILCKEIISVDKVSIFFCASSILLSRSITEVKVLLVFSKFWLILSFTPSLIANNLFSRLSFNLVKSSVKFLIKPSLNSFNSLIVLISKLLSLSVILDSFIFFISDITINIIINTSNIIIK